ncbi:DNA-binding protein RFX5 isoform X2 [Phyllopteryx taeniolatus]|uniref:DNA-binding protein RFX5 isoform X2 n=1 Tax=Phyllopteryx taeniolatus TaxID=161469 RepID=UPI002AD5ADF9|nr:DNA-binding protein RFX5 isoform X2 [Phyllopteryx taeniolatus]
MLEEQHHRPGGEEGDADAADGDTEPSMLLQKLKTNISKSVQTKVDQILQDVQRFSDNDKLYLYLQLPSGLGGGDKRSDSAPPPARIPQNVYLELCVCVCVCSGGGDGLFNTSEQLHTCNWIRSHLEEHSDTCLPKQDVYETYKRYCENLEHRPLSAANFGKIIRDIFPNIKARRLGGRGQSKYCYSGIRRKTVLNIPLLPNLDLKNDPAELTELVQTYKQEVTEAACKLICDWAQKILKHSFDTVVEIARYLIQEHIVNPRCSQAEVLASAALAGGHAKPHKVIKKTPLASKCEGDTPTDLKRDCGDPASTTTLKMSAADKNMPSTKSLSLEAPPSPAVTSLRPAVEAYMKQLPRILPRSSLPEKTPLSVRSSPPSLAPKDASGAGAASGTGGPAAAAASGGGVKVIAMATLPQQQGGPLPLMIVPQGCLSYEREKVTPPASVLQKVREGKRPLEATVGTLSGGMATPPVKRKRGRPRKPRPDDSLPPPALPTQPPPHGPIITSVTGGVIQKASSSASQSVLELVIQEPPGLLLSALPTAPDAAQRGQPGSGGVVVQCQPGGGGPPEPERHARPVLLFQSAGNAGWELAPSGRTPMVEVIQKAPRPNNNNNKNNNNPPLAAPRLQRESGEVEIMLMPMDVNPPPSSSSSSSVVRKEEEPADSP